MFWCEAARFALLYLKMHVSSCFDSLHTPSKPWFYLQVSRLLPLSSSISFSTPFSISLSPSNLLLASCFPVLLFGCYGEGQPVRVCASMSMSVCVCVCVWVNPSLRGWGGDSRSHKNSHTHTLWPLAPKRGLVLTCSLCLLDTARGLFTDAMFTQHMSVCMCEREREWERERGINRGINMESTQTQKAGQPAV